MPPWAPRSLRGRLLAGILLPVALVVALNALSLYHQALQAANTAYDRTLLATAKSIGEQLHIRGSGDAQHPFQLHAAVPYSALEAFEADTRSRLYYKVTGFQGETVSGFDLPVWRGRIPAQGPYAALVDFYDDHYRGRDVRVAVLLQPVASTDARGMATIQVAETLELRQTLAGRILFDTLWRQAALLAVIVLVVWVVVQRATRPVRALSNQLDARADNDLTPLDGTDAPRELAPLLDATNRVMARLAHLLAHQKRFVRDASHQLRTPLAVLKAQVQSARRGDLPASAALHEIEHTVDRATQLTQQMLALAKVEQVHQQDQPIALSLTDAAREVALDVAPLAADKGLDFEVEADEPVWVLGHAWMLRELTRNLLHNAVRASPAHDPAHSRVLLRVRAVHDPAAGDQAELCVRDTGPGIDDSLRQRLFEPFHAGAVPGGTGLGLAICREICDRTGARLALDNRTVQSRVEGLDAVVRWPLLPPPTPP